MLCSESTPFRFCFFFFWKGPRWTCHQVPVAQKDKHLDTEALSLFLRHLIIIMSFRARGIKCYSLSISLFVSAGLLVSLDWMLHFISCQLCERMHEISFAHVKIIISLKQRLPITHHFSCTKSVIKQPAISQRECTFLIHVESHHSRGLIWDTICCTTEPEWYNICVTFPFAWNTDLDFKLPIYSQMTIFLLSKAWNLKGKFEFLLDLLFVYKNHVLLLTSSVIGWKGHVLLLTANHKPGILYTTVGFCVPQLRWETFYCLFRRRRHRINGAWRQSLSLSAVV